MGTKIIFVSLPSLFFFASFFAATHAFPSVSLIITNFFMSILLNCSAVAEN